MRLSNILIDKGLVNQEQMDRALEFKNSKRIRLDRALIQTGAVSEKDLLATLGEHLNMPLVSLAQAPVDPEVVKLLPPKLVYRRRVMPLWRRNGLLEVAISNPFESYALDDIQLLTGQKVRAVLGCEEEIERLIKEYYGLGGDTINELTGGLDDGTLTLSADGTKSEDLMEMAQEASVIKLVNEIIVEAVNERASDIHIEPYEGELSIRYRVDGVLRPASVPTQIHQFQAAIISRIKILANLNIAERRVPQDGRIKFYIGGRQIDVRVSVIPMIFGEGIVMRLLDKANVLFTLPQLGMDEETFASFKQLIARPHGIILVTGPTGSGKTTTLYAALNAIVGKEIKVLTVEDPVEYNLQGVNQIPVDHQVGMSFERGLRSILRHDPDVVMIGEIRDLETAQAAVQASLTGHLVLSTLHTNDACSAPMRLLDMGIEPYLVSSTLIAAMAQRLVRKLCNECKEAYEANPKTLPSDFKVHPSERLYRAVGCDSCRQSGYRGRSGVYELMLMNDDIAELITYRKPTYEIVTAARKNGLRFLREDGWLKTRRGITDVSEVVKNTAI
ncbi:MAG: GspE/PulE family protein [Limisphaerales bacterium]|jgi:type II secretion system protein E|nr:ATPase, T2SS/T4P/T4SS family [Verrucomicrobiota bacterium]